MYDVLRVWFQNRRAKWKKRKKTTNVFRNPGALLPSHSLPPSGPWARASVPSGPRPTRGGPCPRWGRRDFPGTLPLQAASARTVPVTAQRSGGGGSHGRHESDSDAKYVLSMINEKAYSFQIKRGHVFKLYVCVYICLCHEAAYDVWCVYRCRLQITYPTTTISAAGTAPQRVCGPIDGRTAVSKRPTRRGTYAIEGTLPVSAAPATLSSIFLSFIAFHVKRFSLLQFLDIGSREFPLGFTYRRAFIVNEKNILTRDQKGLLKFIRILRHQNKV
ncbi:hypothetical protein CEXT_458091 [Caerostris extrusa]|uniref:Homeobox domain-containing protein n=1 Tax=Caerostris extrusa TaxID=172846 RepID=A0AAV4WT75_CAEEX|nr:hypothetical protein CEXT_458091 [Caerostris extrusa]